MEERRAEYPEILLRLNEIERKVNGGLKDQFEDLKLTQRLIWDKHDIEAKEFRNKTEVIWMKVLSRLDKLPCEARENMFKHMWINIFSIWGIIGSVLLAVAIAKLGGL